MDVGAILETIITVHLFNRSEFIKPQSLTVTSNSGLFKEPYYIV